MPGELGDEETQQIPGYYERRYPHNTEINPQNAPSDVEQPCVPTHMIMEVLNEHKKSKIRERPDARYK